MEMFNSKIMGNKSPHLIDSQRDQQLILSRSRSPLHSFTNSGFNSPTSDPLDNRDAALIRYSSTAAAAAAAGVVSSPIQVLGKFHQLLLQQNHHTSNLSSSRGSSSSPLSSIENLKTPPSRSPPGFNTPVKVEEEVLVMDGILVSSSSPSPAGGRSKSGLDSPGGNSSLYKTEICRAWDNTKNCPYGFRCQVSASSLISSPPGFTRGKEDVRPTRYSKNKSSEVCKTFSTVGSCPCGAKCRFVHHGAAVTREATTPSSSTITSEREKNITLVISPNAPVDKRVIKEELASIRSFTMLNWSPADDNIPITKLSITDIDQEEESHDDQNKADKEVVDARINDVLYGQPDHRRRRLPVFIEICPTAEDHDQ